MLEGHRDLVASLIFSPDSRRLASVDWTGGVKLWDSRSGRELKTLSQPKVEEPMAQSVLRREFGDRTEGGFWPGSSPRFTVCGRFLMMAWHTVDRFERQNGPGQLRVFSLDDNDVRDHDHVEHYTVSPTEPLLVSEGQKQLSFHWLPDRRTALVIVPEEFGKVADLAFSREGKDVRLLSTDGKLAQVTLAAPTLTLQTLRKIEVLPDAILRFAPDGEHVVSRESRLLPEDDQVESSNQWWFAAYDLRALRVAQRRVTNSPSYRPGLMDGSKVLDPPTLETYRQPDGQQMLARGNDGFQRLRYRGERSSPSPPRGRSRARGIPHWCRGRAWWPTPSSRAWREAIPAPSQ